MQVVILITELVIIKIKFLENLTDVKMK